MSTQGPNRSTPTQQAIVPGSLQAIAQATGTSIAQTFLNADVIVLIDVSGSMDAADARDHQRRYDIACEELARLQQELPGRIAVVAFSTNPVFVPGGRPPFLAGTTDLARALAFVQPADGTVRYLVISDGEPNDEAKALAIAAQFTSPIDTIYVGPASDRRGQALLTRLAQATRGRARVAYQTHELAATVQKLLTSGSGAR